jgi:tetratricopeptide (TPR) repeat protein
MLPNVRANRFEVTLETIVFTLQIICFIIFSRTCPTTKAALMNSNDAHYVQAENLRNNGNTSNDFHSAIIHYKAYLKGGGTQKVEACHMIGVCYQRLHEYLNAVECYLSAMDGASDYQLGNIQRDLAASYGAMGDYHKAEIAIAKSLDLLPENMYPDAYAATIGFKARLMVRQGDVMESLRVFAEADFRLHGRENRRTELYNKLDYASALSRAGLWLDSRRVAFRSLMLSTSKDPQTHHPYGSLEHHCRALVLLIGGYSLETFLDTMNRRSSYLDTMIGRSKS